MPIDILVDDSKDLTTFDCFGDVFYDDIIEAVIMLFEGMNLKPTRKLLCDMRKVECLYLSPYQLDKLADLYLSKNNGTKAAILAPMEHVLAFSLAFERRIPKDKRDFKIIQSLDNFKKSVEKGLLHKKTLSNFQYSKLNSSPFHETNHSKQKKWD